MAKINENFLKLQAGYLFPEIGRRVNAFCESHPAAKVIKMGIGDVTQPLCPAIVAAMHTAVDEMAVPETFRGYGPEQGYGFLRDAIAKNDYQDRGIAVLERIVAEFGGFHAIVEVKDYLAKIAAEEVLNK